MDRSYDLSQVSRTRTLSLPADAQGADDATGSVYFIGTATVLIRYACFTILTDPNFLHQGDHVHLGYGLTSERLTQPAMELRDLPPVDIVVLSHFHEDHFDRFVQQNLDKDLPIVTTPEAAAALRKIGFSSAHGIERWQSFVVTKGGARLKISAMPARHGPSFASALLPSTMGSMLEFENADEQTTYRIYISGDTLVYDDLKEIPKRYPDVELGLLHLGGTRILGMLLVTMDAEQGVEALRIISPRLAIPIHYNDYTVFKSPLEDFQAAVNEAGLGHKVKYLRHGETYEFKVAPAR